MPKMKVKGQRSNGSNRTVSRLKRTPPNVLSPSFVVDKYVHKRVPFEKNFDSLIWSIFVFISHVQHVRVLNISSTL